jgi:hypothetical protein
MRSMQEQRSASGEDCPLEHREVVLEAARHGLPNLVDVHPADLFVRWPGQLGGADEGQQIEGHAVPGWRHLR